LPITKELNHFLSTIDFSNPTDKQHHDDMVAKVETMLELHQQKAAGKDVDQSISDLDAQIDALVYALYELTEDEIAIVEGTS
jgi:type II restriction/modification system DNA methylase subunit YeeA